jgi:TP901 family phage tail tape measure protein
MANTEKIVVQVVVKGEKDLKKVGKSAGVSAMSFGKMAGAIGLAVTAFREINKQIGAAINTFKKFEFQMAKVKATTGATEKDFKKLTATAKQLGRTTFFTASQVGELQMNYAKLGFTTSEILDAQEATLRLATATGSDLARAAVVAGAAVRGFNLDASETERVVDVMAVAFTSSALDIEKFQTSMTKVAPIAAGAGISIESTSAVMGKLTDAGIEASIAGTSLRNIFLKMQDSSSDLSQHLGFTIKSSADLEKALIQLNKEGLSNEEIMGLVDIRQVAAFATMVNGTDSILDLTDALEQANGAAQEMADIMADTLEGDIITAKSAWEGFQLSIMTGSSNVSKMLRTAVKTWTFILNGFSDDLKSTEDVATDMFTNASKAAKEETNKIIKDRGEGATTYSRQLFEEMHLLKNTLRRKEASLEESQDRINKLTKDGQLGAFQVNQQEIADEEKKLTEKTQIFEATKQAIKDLAEEVEFQKEKETNAVVTANAKQFQANQQAIREEEIADRKNQQALEETQREKEKTQREALALEKKEFQESQDALKIALEEELNADKQNLIDGLITKEEFDLRVFEAEQAHLENMKNLNIAYGEDVSSINGQILDNELNMIADKAAAEANAAKEKEDGAKKEIADRKETIDGVAQLGDQLITLAGEDEKMQGIRKAGIALSSAAAIANNIQALSEMTVGVTSQAKLPFPANIIGMVTTLSTVVSLLANIKAMKSAFGDGGVIETFANGGMVHGKSHAQGGEKFAVGGRVVELEGGEAVINKRSTAMFGKQLSAMNSAGGGVKFADGGLLNMPSFSQQQFNAIGQNQMMGAMGSSGKVVVVEADITDSQNIVNVIQSEATI